MINTSVPRGWSSRVTTAPPARIGRPGDRAALLRVRLGLTEGTEALLRDRPTSARGVDQVVLHVEQRLTCSVRGMRNPGAVRLQLPRSGALVEGDVEPVPNLSDVCWIGDRDQHFHPAIEVAVHQIRGADPDGWRTIIGEPEEAAVFQEAAEDAAHPDVLAETRHTRSDRADAAYPEVHRNSCFRGAVERVGGGFVNDRVDFDLDTCRLAVLMVGDLVVDPVDQSGSNPVWRNEQALVLSLLGHSRQMVEQPADVIGDDGIGSEQASVFIQP